jgi:hypothetical protein
VAAAAAVVVFRIKLIVYSMSGVMALPRRGVAHTERTGFRLIAVVGPQAHGPSLAV